MRRWQHKVILDKVLVGMTVPESDEDPERAEILDRYGRDGWELVSVVLQSYRRETDPTVYYGYTFFRYYFKREIEEPESVQERRS
jgi:hypothetical protein